MSSKKKKLSSKRSHRVEEPVEHYDCTKFVNLEASKRFTLISTNRSFIKEKGFHHPENFFKRIIANKWWKALFQPPRPAAIMVVREFYANLVAHVVKKVRVRGVLVDFSTESINKFYNLEPINEDDYLRLQEAPQLPRSDKNAHQGQGGWKTNNKGHAMHFKSKHLAYIPKVWHHFITSRLIPTTNVCKVTAKHALLNYAIIQDIPFDVGQVIENVILYNKDATMNLRHPFLIYGLCKKARVPLEGDEAWIHPIKEIVVKKNKPGVPRPEGMYESSNEPLNEEELRAYQAMQEG